MVTFCSNFFSDSTARQQLAASKATGIRKNYPYSEAVDCVMDMALELILEAVDTKSKIKVKDHESHLRATSSTTPFGDGIQRTVLSLIYRNNLELFE